MTDLFEQRVRAAARAIPTPEPPADLIGRVLAEREAGHRTILPRDRTRVPRATMRASLVAGIVAATIVALAVATWRRHDTLTIVSDGVFIGTAEAAQPGSARRTPALRLSGETIRPRRYDYRLDVIDADGHSTPDGRGTLDVTATTVENTAALRVVLHAEQSIDQQRRTMAETLLVARSGLRLLARQVHVQPYRRFASIHVRQRVANDSVIGEMTADDGIRRSFARRLPAGDAPYISDAIAPLALVGVPLRDGARGSISLLGWAVIPSDVAQTVTLRVIGDERISTAAGPFDCWKVDVVAGAEHRTEWIRKSDGLGIRSEDSRVAAHGRRRFELLNP